MAYTTKFFLKEPKKKGDSLVYMTFCFGDYIYGVNGKRKYSRLKYSTGEKINPAYWNFDNCRAKKTDLFPHQEFNFRLEKMKNAVENIYRTILNNEERPSVQNIKEKLDIEYGKESRTGKMTLFAFIEHLVNNPNLVNGKELSQKTIAAYETTKKHLLNFAAWSNKKIDFDAITLEFYNDFLDYLIRELQFSTNTGGKHIKILKTFMNAATEKGFNTNMQYKSKRFIVLHESGQNIYLTMKELETLYNKDLSKNKRLDRIRDLFLVGCYTGLRFSDFTNIQPENIYTNDKGIFLKINTQKTGQTVVIPIHPIVRMILDKYKNKLPEAITNQKMNVYLKELCREAKINQKVQKTIFTGGKRVSKTFEKCDIVSTHTARRSFATNAYLSGMDSLSIMRITGHQTEDSFLRYIQVSDEESAIKLQSGEFFKATKYLHVIHH
jgi:integrase